MKTKNYKFLMSVLLMLVLSIEGIQAQEEKHCGTTEVMRKLYEQHPELIQKEAAYNLLLDQQIKAKQGSRAAEAVYIIPVVFHVIHTYGSENISDAQIQDQINILNRDYRKLNADTSAIIKPFDTLARDIKIEFRLARLDPDGNCTNGIDRIYSHKTNKADDQSKLNPWPRDKYLNVWTVKTIGEQGVAGYAYYPSAVDNFLFPYDGILILSDYIGSIGTSNVNNSRALTHEIGHWLNLPHTWGNTNDPNVACGDEGVNDTPKTKGHLNCTNPKDYTCDSQTMTGAYTFNGVVANQNIAATYDFANVTLTSGASDPTAAPSQMISANQVAISLTNYKAVGVSANSSVAGSFGFSGWGTGAANGELVFANLTGAVDQGKYYEFKIKPTANYLMSLTNVSFNFKRNATGVRSFVVRSSVDNFATNLSANVTTNTSVFSIQPTNVFFVNKDSVSSTSMAGCQVTVGGAGFANTADSVVFRIYAYNAENSTGTFEIDNVNIGGTFSSLVGLTDPTNSPNQINTASVLAVEFTKFEAVGVSPTPNVSGRFAYSGWDIGAVNGDTTYANHIGTLNTAKYYEFKIKPRSGQVMSLTGITFNFKRDTAGVRTYSVRSSANNYASNLTASISPANTALSVRTGNVFYVKKDTIAALNGSKITLTGTAYTNLIDPITFRIYGFNAENVSGSFEIDNVTVTGTFGTMENVQNYMEYSYCSKMFTKDQKDRMRTALEGIVSQRNHLWTGSNLLATGTNGTLPECIPSPDFYANRTNICQGGTVTFNKNILNAAATSLQWTFTGGTPSTSTANAPTVTYSAAGVYPVKLKATNAAGTDSIVKNTYIVVNSNTANISYNGGIVDDLQNTSQFNNFWQIADIDKNGKTWKLTSTAGYNSSQSAVMEGFLNYVNDVDDLITPIYDLSSVTNSTLTFRCAAASRASQSIDINDVLKVYVSVDCGQSWQLRSTFQGSNLINNGYSGSYFTPTTASQWAFKTVAIPNTFATAKVRFKFEYTTGKQSNNIYIDDININNYVGIDENIISEANVALYPNPFNEVSTLYYHLNKSATTKIEVLDMMGKKIVEVSNNNQSEGDYTFEISKQQLNLSNGIYMIRLSIDNASVNKKLIITE